MAIIYTYPVATPKGSDYLIGTVTYDASAASPTRENPTRQFRIADPDWFDNEFKLHKIKLWLNNFLISKMYLEVMEKFKPWEPGQNKILF